MQAAGFCANGWAVCSVEPVVGSKGGVDQKKVGNAQEAQPQLLT